MTRFTIVRLLCGYSTAKSLLTNGQVCSTGLQKDKALPTGWTITKSPKQLAKKAEGSKRGVHLVPRWMECEDHWQARAPPEMQFTGDYSAAAAAAPGENVYPKMTHSELF